jgi:biopolymer transport protein ExbB
MIELFIKGGPIMWPLLLTSIVALSMVLERVCFIVMEKGRRQPRIIREIFRQLEHGDPTSAIRVGEHTKDFVGRILVAALKERSASFTNALMAQSAEELRRFNRGLTVLDTVITLAPLLGLLGTVTGMIHSFGLLGGSELDAPSAITGGIAEALIATAFGLGIAITALLPYNYLNSRLEDARREIEVAGNQLELLLIKLSGDKHDSLASV